VRVIDPDKADRERKKRERLRLELHQASQPLNPGGELPAEAKNLIRHHIKKARDAQTWHRPRDEIELPQDPILAPDEVEG